MARHFHSMLVGLVLMAACLVALGDAFLTDDDKEELLRAHNFYRSRVRPVATNMAKLVWDDELALLAQFWAVNCELMANENRHEQSTEFDYVGQLNSATLNYTINLTSLVFEWYFDGRSYDYSQGACIDEDGEEDEEACDTYVQLVWAETTHLGCGGYFCDEIRGLDDEDNQQDDNQLPFLVTCLYGPGGGYAGERPYRTGREACSSCPDYLPLCDNNLCTGSGAHGTVATVSMAMLLLICAGISSLF